MPHTLLLADDSVTVQRVIELTFADENVRVVAVGDGAAAIEQIEREPPDIVLTDIGMPGRDGYEVAAYVKERPHLAHIPVVLLAGAFEPVDRARAAAIGCDDVLVKPFEPHLVIARVKELLFGGRRPLRSAVLDVPHLFAPPAPRETADELFARLDGALARFDAPAQPARPAAVPLPAPHPVVEPAQRPPESPEPSSKAPEPGAPELLVQAFHAILATERGEPAPARSEGGSSAEPPPDPWNVDRIVERVLVRLSDQAVRDAARQVVGPIAERLVREEIERIRSSH